MSSLRASHKLRKGTQLKSGIVMVAIGLVFTGQIAGQCRINTVETGEYSVVIESAEGAVGDVVGIEVGLVSRYAGNVSNMGIIICHNSLVAEALPERAEFYPSYLS